MLRRGGSRIKITNLVARKAGMSIFSPFGRLTPSLTPTDICQFYIEIKHKDKCKNEVVIKNNTICIYKKPN